MKSGNILCILCLLLAGIGYLSAGSPRKVKADKYGVKESISAELLSKKKLKNGKISFKCRITRRDDNYMMFARILKNDSSMRIVRPGVMFALSNGDSVVLRAGRTSACCSSWADGRWYNAAFELKKSDVVKLGEAEIISITIPFNGGEICRATSTGKRNAIAKLLQSLEED